ncbi:MAG: hypothetical protein ACHQIM_19500 [Sphingobacteriales bacterium]
MATPALDAILTMPVSHKHGGYLACGAREAFTRQAFARHCRARGPDNCLNPNLSN